MPSDETGSDGTFRSGDFEVYSRSAQLTVNRMIAVQLDHLHVKSSASDVSARFYAEAFRANIVSTTEVNGRTRMVLELGGIRLFIEDAAAEAASASAIPAKGLEHIGLQVSDLDEAVRHLDSIGIALAVGPTQGKPGIRTAFLYGPDGEYIELIERRNIPQ